ncbi:ankyrin repeat protein [Metarhizium guizhouense ARSEF 977]|uniref:Ankyrin repeat protein n=1 Tax=Metarhizium guizhouense (strain ARSEF 977) TaxID=1276136 RepID=A0A0B4H8F5_METGA|nr:ankyrin repeat protein [Metarhizium guizhouense ARSEF 977]
MTAYALSACIYHQAWIGVLGTAVHRHLASTKYMVTSSLLPSAHHHQHTAFSLFFSFCKTNTLYSIKTNGKAATQRLIWPTTPARLKAMPSFCMTPSVRETWNALEARDEVMALMLIEHGVDIKQRRNACEYSSLMVACHGPLPRAAQKLLEMGADVEDRSWDGMSPLMVASHRSDLATAKKLIDFGADLKAKKPAGGETALYYAVWYRRLDMTKLLVREGADVNQPLATGFTALSVAADNNSPEIASFLLANGADVNRPTGSVTACIYADDLHVNDLPTDALLTPLHLAAENGHADMARLLLDNGAQVNAASARGYTPLMLAAHNGHADTVSILIRSGADISAHTADGCRALSMAALFYDGLLRREVKLGKPSTARPRASRFGFERDCEQPPRQYEKVIALLAKAGSD